MAELFTVTGARETTRFLPDGTVEQVQVVTFRLNEGGATGSVTVPVASFTPGNVAELIEDYAANLAAVTRL